MYIEIKNVQFINKGAALMLSAIIDVFARAGRTDLKFVLATRSRDFERKIDFPVYQKVGNLKYRVDWSRLTFFLPKRILRAKGWVTHSGVDLVLDASGYAYGGKWTRRMLKHTVRQAEQLKAVGGKYIFLPQAFGEFNQPGDKQLLERMLNAAELVCARDKVSYQNIVSVVGPRCNLKIYPDFTNLYAPSPKLVSWPDNASSGVFTVVPNQKMVSHFGGFGEAEYISLLEGACREMATYGLRIVLLNHEGKGDQALINMLKQHLSDLGPAVTVVEGLNADQVKAFIGRSRFLLSSRFHGCVSGLSQSIPTLATSWSHKYEMLFEDYGVSNFLVSDERGMKLALSEIVRNEEAIIQKLSDASCVEKSKTEDMWDAIKQSAFDRA